MRLIFQIVLMSCILSSTSRAICGDSVALYGYESANAVTRKVLLGLLEDRAKFFAEVQALQVRASSVLMHPGAELTDEEFEALLDEAEQGAARAVQERLRSQVAMLQDMGLHPDEVTPRKIEAYAKTYPMLISLRKKLDRYSAYKEKAITPEAENKAWRESGLSPLRPIDDSEEIEFLRRWTGIASDRLPAEFRATLREYHNVFARHGDHLHPVVLQLLPLLRDLARRTILTGSD